MIFSEQMDSIDIDDQSVEVSNRIGANSTTGPHDTETDAENLEENPIRKKAKGVHIGKTQKLRSPAWTLF